MSLFDRDKSGTGRLSPMPTARDINQSRMAHGTIGFTLTQDSTDATLGKLVVKDGRMLLITENNTFVDLSNGNIEIKRSSGDVMGRLGYDAVSEGKVQIAKTSTSL